MTTEYTLGMGCQQLCADIFALTGGGTRVYIAGMTISEQIVRAREARGWSAAKLAREADRVVVVGGRTSANTCRLAAICAAPIALAAATSEDAARQAFVCTLLLDLLADNDQN